MTSRKLKKPFASLRERTNKLIPQYLSALANHLWQSTLFAGVAGLLTLGLRRNRAAVRYGVWLVASLKFLIPFSILVGIGHQLEWSLPAEIAKPQVISVVGQISRPFSAANPDFAQDFTQSSPVPEPPPASTVLPAVLLYVWLGGAGFVLFIWLREWLRVRRTLYAASPLPLHAGVAAMSSRSALEPGVVGIFRPVLLLPEGIHERLTTDQFKAILVHEQCHVRRRDNLAAALHMIVETLFWFHPLVWWIERRLVDERERACDEEVLRVTGEPQTYAEGILNVCKFYKESSLVCVSGVTGSNLKTRIEEIMTNRIAREIGLARALLLIAAGLMVVVVPVAFGMVHMSRAERAAAVTEAREFPALQTPQPAPPQSAAPSPATASSTPQVKGEPSKGNFLDDIQRAGYTDLDVDHLVAMKIHGVDGNFIRQMRDAGYQLDADQLVAFKIHGVSGEFVQQMRDAGLHLTGDQLVAFRIHDVTADYINQLKQAGLANLNGDDLIAMKIHKVEPAWIREIESLGYTNLSADQLLALRIHGVSADFVRDVQSHGFKNLNIDQLIQLKRLDILK
jgi:beta-lactamase regulating signal transducer with metallopeptidase domain